MLTQLQRRKMVRQFTLLDADRNGFVEESDFQQVARNLTARFHQSDSPAAGRVHADYRGMWRALRAAAVPAARAADNGAQLSRDEFIGSIERGILGRSDGFDRVIRPLADDVMDMIDINGDDRISSQEFRAWSDACGVQAHDSGEEFHRLDRDGDGYLTRDEVQRAWWEFYCATDPDAPGNWLFGRV